MIKFAIIGTGWRSEFFLRIAAACSHKFRVVGVVTRDINRAAVFGDQFNVPLFGSIDELLASAKPHFVVTSVPWDSNPSIIKVLTEKGIPVLSETPPARKLNELIEVYKLVQNGAKIQVAEQYWAQPHHAARLAFAHSGKLGTVRQAQISVAHGYHGISLMRRFLGIGYENCTVSGQSFTASIVEGPGRSGPPQVERLIENTQDIVTFNFGDKFGIFDFTGEQYFSWIRGQRLLVRGSHGEIVDEQVAWLQDFETPLTAVFKRAAAGINGNLEGHYLKGIQVSESWIYRNPLAPAPLSDEEIAIGTCLLRMAEYADGSNDFYSLAEACQDRYLDILMAEALETGNPIQSKTQIWAK
ncbi:MAG: Gfo/Idh/MocA family oxidoreductase [Chloroflexota bacterium]